MKRLLNISRCMAAILGVVAILSACTPEPIHHRGRGDWPDDNIPGREGGKQGGNSGTFQLDFGYANFSAITIRQSRRRTIIFSTSTPEKHITMKKKTRICSRTAASFSLLTSLLMTDQT